MDHFHTTKVFFESRVKPLLSYSNRRRIDILLDYVEDKTVLDLGCIEHESAIAENAQWWLHALIQKKAKTLLGVDYNQEACAELNEKGYHIRAADVESLNLGEKFDVVMSGELFEHLSNHRSFLESVKRHLNEDGIWVASMPNGNSLNYFAQTLVFAHEVDAWDHTSFFTPVTLSVMLKKCGFTPVKIILYQPDEIFHHDHIHHRIAAYLFNRFMQLVCFVRPCLARGLIVVAKANPNP